MPKQNADNMEMPPAKRVGNSNPCSPSQMLMVRHLVQKVVEENEYTVLRPNTHYRTLHLDFSDNIAYLPDVRTYEGLPLCSICLQFRLPYHFSKSLVDETKCVVPLVKDARPCAKCGLPVRTLRKNTNYQKAHTNKPSREEKSICQKVCDMDTTDESWDIHRAFNTLVCPACQVPGFNLKTLNAHISKNECGDRKTYARRKQGAFAMNAVECEHCHFWFHPLRLKSHTCGIALDPIWRGVTEMPDITIPFPVYCNELPVPFGPAGYGGGFIREDGKGCIPEEVLRKSWHVPFATNPAFAAEQVQEKDVQTSIRRLIIMLAKEAEDYPLGDGPGAVSGSRLGPSPWITVLTAVQEYSDSKWPESLAPLVRSFIHIPYY